MKAVIIAAGLGNRLGSLTSEKPKALVQANGRELILRVMDFLDAGDFSERIVITGYKSDSFRDFLKVNCKNVTVIENPDYKKGSIKTVEKALPHLDEGFLLMNVDHIYPKRMLPAILENGKGITAICDFDRTLTTDDMKVKLDYKKRVISISKTLDRYDGGYIGMTYCSDEMLKTYRESVQRTLSLKGDSVNVESILDLLSKEKFPVETFDASGFGWLEVDTQDDLNSANNILRSNPDYLL